MKRQYSWLAVVLAFAMSACASGPKRVEFPPDTQPQAKLDELRDRLAADRIKQYDQLSPTNFEQARVSLAKSQHEIDERDTSDQILKDEGDAAARLNIVEENGARQASLLNPVLSARQAAIAAQAPVMLPQQFASADEKLRDFGRQIESGDFHPQVKDISRLEAIYSNVELSSVKKDKLGSARAMIERAERDNAKSEAPITLSAAQISYDSALRSIEANRRNPAGYQQAVSDSMKSADKLDQVMNTIGNSRTSEAAAIKIYDQQQELASTQQSLNQQQAQTEAAQNQVAAERQSVNALQNQNSQYAKKAANDQKIEKVKEEFSPDEAEVFRDGNKIVLRLKKMKFASARADLTKSSVETLQKVKDMIAAVPVAKVIVEGYTDNVGSENKNLALSQSRAESVKQYLVAEKSVPQDQVEAHGFGYEHPLASNKTPEGRAQNRRVDVIIETTPDFS